MPRLAVCVIGIFAAFLILGVALLLCRSRRLCGDAQRTAARLPASPAA